MSLTSDMKDELARAVITTPSEVAAEVSATLRFAGGLHLVGGRILVEAELDSPVAARRLRTYLQALYNAESSVVVVSGSSLRRGKRYVVRVVHKADELARLTGLVDSMRRPVRGLPPVLVASGTAEAAAIWRGAFLARGSLMEPGRSSSLEITCPGPEVALAMVGCARKLGAAARSKEVRGTDRVSVRDSDAIGTLIAAMGAPQTFEAWQQRRERREARGSANRVRDPRRRRSRAPARGRHVALAIQASLSGRARQTHESAPHERRRRRTHPPTAGPGGQGRARTRHPRYRIRPHPRDA